jgi:hypothetical protein
MGAETNVAADKRTRQKEAEVPPKKSDVNKSAHNDTEYLSALEALEGAQERLLSAAVAFCDGLISAGQLRAVRELLREKERRIDELGGLQASPFLDDNQPEPEETEVSVEQPVAAITTEDTAIDAIDLDTIDDPELKQRLEVLDQKIHRLEQDFQQGRINASQYRAIYRHYMEQREVALRLREKYPDSDRWQVVLEEGKTRFLLQLNEATCHAVGLYDIKNKDRIFVHGEMPETAEEAMALLGTFGSADGGSADGRMYATKTDDGESLLLIPGLFTVSLSIFSQDPPAWQVRALREVHRNFEAANRRALQKGNTDSLIFPDLNRFVKTS